MSIKIKKDTFYSVLLALSIAIPYLNSYELTFTTWSLTILFTLSYKYPLIIIRYIIPFALIFITGIISFIGKDYNTYSVIRDMTYFLKPAMGLLAGYQLGKILGHKILKACVYTAVGISIVHLLVILVVFIVHQKVSIHVLREYGGFFSDFEVYVLIMLIFRRKFSIQISKTRAQLFIALIGISSFLYLSRTNFIQFFVLYIGMLGYFALTKKALMRIVGVLAFCLLGYSVILAINPKRNGQGLEAFLYKVKVAPIEPFKTKIDVTDWKDFNDNYRSFENIITVREVNKHGTESILIGRGFGSMLNLGQEVFLDGSWEQHIPKVHNGYMTVYLKTGLIGVLLFLYSNFMLFFHKKSGIVRVEYINRLLISTGVFLIFSNWVFLGLYFVADTKALLVGALLAYRAYIAGNNNAMPAPSQ